MGRLPVVLPTTVAGTFGIIISIIECVSGVGKNKAGLIEGAVVVKTKISMFGCVAATCIYVYSTNR